MTVLLERAHIEQFRGIVSKHLGFQFDESKFDMLADVIRQRMEALKCATISSYLNLLTSAGNERDELRVLAQQLTVNETYFFRNPDHFRAFTEIVIPHFRARNSPREFRILSAGCASGDEAYSLAILARSHIPDFQSWNVRIRGIDVSQEMIQKAKVGRYSAWALRGTPVDIREQYFRSEGKDYVLDERIRSMVSFEERNLIEHDADFWRSCAYDVVFCRNVAMYFSPDNMRALIERIAGALVQGGFLFLGHAETLRGISQDFHLCHTHDTFYYQLRGDPAIKTHTASESASALTQTPSVAPVIGFKTSWVEAIQNASERIAALANRTSVVESDARTRQAPAAVKPRGQGLELGMVVEFLRQERFKEAMDLLNTLPSETQSGSDAQLLRAVLLTNAGNLPQAENICSQMLLQDELNVGAHYLTALCRERAGDLSAAMEHDRVAAYLDNTFAMPHLHLALLKKRNGDIEAARREFEQARSLLEREDAARVLLYGGGFSREALIELCAAELRLIEGKS